jgi:hypothetical protein
MIIYLYLYILYIYVCYKKVRDAFTQNELVRIDCKGMETSDYKKIGSKLRVNFLGSQCVLNFRSV